MEKREEWTFLPKFTIPVVQIIVGNRYLHVLALKETISSIRIQKILHIIHWCFNVSPLYPTYSLFSQTNVSSRSCFLISVSAPSLPSTECLVMMVRSRALLRRLPSLLHSPHRLLQGGLAMYTTGSLLFFSLFMKKVPTTEGKL